MKMIALFAVVAMLLVDFFGPRSSVGGPMTYLFVLFLVMLAVGLHEAWANGRGVGGWIANIFAAIFGGLAAAMVIGLVMDEVMPVLELNGSFAESSHPAKYVLLAAMALQAVLASWLAIEIVNRLFSRSRAGNPAQ